MKQFFWVVAVLLLAFTVCFGEINQGVTLREGPEQSCTLDSAQMDTSEIIFSRADFGSYAEQGWSMLSVKSDTTDTFNVWFSSGVIWNRDTIWTSRVQCVWAEVMADDTPLGYINMAFLQSLVLTDSSKARTGYAPALLLRVSVEPSGTGLDAVTSMNRFFAKLWHK